MGFINFAYVDKIRNELHYLLKKYVIDFVEKEVIHILYTNLSWVKFLNSFLLIRDIFLFLNSATTPNWDLRGMNEISSTEPSFGQNYLCYCAEAGKAEKPNATLMCEL